MTDQEIRLAFGEMTGQEMRTAKAVVSFFERRIEELERLLKSIDCDEGGGIFISCDFQSWYESRKEALKGKI